MTRTLSVLLMGLVVGAGCGDGADPKINPTDASNAATLAGVLSGAIDEAFGDLPQESMCEQAAQRANLLCAGDDLVSGSFVASAECGGAEEASAVCVMVLDAADATCEAVLACGLEPTN